MTKKQLIPGIGARSRSKTYHSRGLWAIKAKNGGTFPAHQKKDKPAGPVEKPPKYYPAEDAPKPLKFRHKIRPTKLRSSITPGTVLIILAGRFKGKRVVFLKQLESGLLLVTGPYAVNGVPLRRVNQVYVIATSTKIDLSAVDCSKITDEYFKKEKEAKEKEAKEKALPAEKKEQQKAVDSKLLAEIEKLPELKGYLGARFSLQRGMKPHQLVF